MDYEDVELVDRFLRTSLGMCGTERFGLDATDPSKVTMAEVRAYHMGVRDILIRLLRERPGKDSRMAIELLKQKEPNIVELF